MHQPTPHREFFDPFAHYTRGVLYFDKKNYTFTAYRLPYKELDNKTWETEQAFNVDYNRLIARKYSG